MRRRVGGHNVVITAAGGGAEAGGVAVARSRRVYHVFVLIAGGTPDVGRARVPFVVLGVGAIVAALVTLQVVAVRGGFQGPLHGLISDYVATPKSASVPWAGLILASVGVNARRRWIALGVAVGLDAVFAAERALRGGALTVGNGPTIVLTALMLVAWLRWSGTERRTALRAAALGALLIVATKVGDAWLEVTILTRPTVLDQYVVLADSALGDPSWVAGRVLDEVGPAASALLHWVYIELPVAAMVVAVWQLRHVASGVWPRHYLVRTFLVLGLVGPLIYVLFPVVGPVFAYGVEGEGHQIGNYWPGVVPAFDPTPAAFGFDDETPRNCMPSMHTAWALAVCLHAWRGPTWLRCVGVFWLVCTLSATLGFGYHYGVDLVAGAVLCLTVEAALRDPKRGWGWFRWRVVGGGAVLLAMLLISYRFLSVAMAQFPVLFGVLVLGSLAGYAYAWFATFRGPVAAPRPAERALAVGNRE